MSEQLITDNIAAVRAERLTAAGNDWATRIAENPESAKLVSSAHGTGVGSVATEVRAGKHTFIIDEPAGLAGDDAGPSPVEYTLGALAACQVVVYRLYAHQLGLTIENIDIQADGNLDVKGFLGVDKDVRPGFSGVTLKVNISGPDSEEDYKRLQQTVDAHCPVLDIVANQTPVEVELTTN